MSEIQEYKERLNKLLELIYLIQKDISGVRLRTPLVIKRKEFSEQVDKVIEALNRDVNIVEKGIKSLKNWLILRKNAISAINNLYNSIEKTIMDSKSKKEIIDRIRMFCKSAQQEFVLSILYLEDLWNRELYRTMNSMEKVTSIMTVTQEKIERYKKEYQLDPDELSSYIDTLLNYILEEKFDKFDELENSIREKMLQKSDI